MRKKALITGITGQDGSYLAEFLLEKDYEVIGMVRRTSTVNFGRIAHIQDKIVLVPGDLMDQVSIIDILREHRPNEVYNLAAQSFVPTSWNQPVLTGEVTALGVTRVLDAIRTIDPTIHFYQASSSEMFGKVKETPQNENTPFYPLSPYAVAKLYGHWITVNYRESYGLFACSGICFNHESPRRGYEFVTRKITHAVAQLALGLRKKPLVLGNLQSRRDWGFAGDYVRAMWLILQQEKPDDFVIATGKAHTVRELVETAFAAAGITIGWEGARLKEVGVNKETGEVMVEVSGKFHRPVDPQLLLGDYSKAQKKLGWKPWVSFEELAQMMVEADIEKLKRDPNPM